MKAQHLLAAAYLIASVCAVVWLWQFWTPQCNEACARGVVLSMYATFLLVPAAALVLAVFTLSGRLSLKLSLAIFALCVACLFVWSGFVTQSALRAAA